MQKQIHEMTAQMADLDKWTQLSILGAWQFIANNNCLTQATRALPDLPDEGEGIEGYTPWEGAMRTLLTKIKSDEKEGGDFATTLPAWLAFQRHVSYLTSELGGDVRDIENTYEWLVARIPSRDRGEADFAMRVRMGMRPGIPRKDFVDAEYEKDMRSHMERVAKGQHAVTFLERMTLETGAQIERGFDDLPEWLEEQLLNKMIEKLKSRWISLEGNRTNPKMTLAKRDEAAGDQMLIVEVGRHYNEEIAPDLSNEQPDTPESE